MIKNSRLTLVLTASLLGLAFFASGCQSTDQDTAAKAPQHETAIMCAKCKTVWLQGPPRHRSGRPARRYLPKGVMTCPDCQSAAETFFKTGQLKHTCDACGGQIEHCEEH